MVVWGLGGACDGGVGTRGVCDGGVGTRGCM